MRKLKKRALAEMEFFEATAAFFRRKRHDDVQTPSSASPSTAPRSISELLDKRRNQRVSHEHREEQSLSLAESGIAHVLICLAFPSVLSDRIRPAVA